jgi:signal transduction histidine kinase
VRTSTHQGLRRLVVFLLATVAVACAPASSPDVRRITELSRLLGTSETPPPDGAPGWESVTLPDYWGPEIREHAVDGWYRAHVMLDEAPRELWAVYLPRVAMNAGAWVNGAAVGESGPFVDPLLRSWNHPQLFVVPAALLKAGDNTLDVRLRTVVGAPGFIRPVYVGPERQLRRTWEIRHWLQVDLAQIVAAATTVTGILMLLVSIGRPEVHRWRWLAVGLIVWSWGSADAFERRVLFSERVWDWSTGLAQFWATVCFALGFHRVFEFHLPRRDAAFVATALAVSAFALLVPWIHAFEAMMVTKVLAFAIAGYLCLLFLKAPREASSGTARRFFLPVVVGAIMGLHDIVEVVTGMELGGVLLFPYIPAVALVTTGWVLLGRLVDSHRETLALNRDLERRVEEKRVELAENYVRLAQLERDRAIADERERLMRDVHDGVGGQLVSTLALAESGEHDGEAVAESIRGAIEDLRLVIDSLDPAEDDLLAVLASVRSRLEPRLLRHGLRFAWQVTDLPPVRGFGPDMALQAMRIVQEAVTNVVKHAHAHTVTVRTGESDGNGGTAGVFIEVRDDGRGIERDAPRGRGLANMARRASRLGGTVEVRSSTDGTAVRLWLPRDRPAA